MDERKVLANRMSALKDCWPWEMWSWGAFMEAIGIDRSSNWEDTVDRVCRLIGGDPEREAAADWVEANGGIDDVRERMGLYSDMLSRIDSIVCGGRRDRFAADTPPDDTAEPFDAILDALVERLMPDGMKWPRFEDGAKVRFGDEYENSNGNVSLAVAACAAQGSRDVRTARVQQRRKIVLRSGRVRLLRMRAAYRGLGAPRTRRGYGRDERQELRNEILSWVRREGG